MMEEMKNKLWKKRNLFILIFLFAVVLGIRMSYMVMTVGSEDMTDGSVMGFQMGLMIGLGMLALINIIKMSSILKDEKKIKIYANQMKDERLKAIRSKAGMPMLLYTSVLMLGAAIIAGYFNEIVFYTLVIAAMVQLLIGVVIKLYYMKTM